jgi:hypothetical protein
MINIKLPEVYIRWIGSDGQLDTHNLWQKITVTAFDSKGQIIWAGGDKYVYDSEGECYVRESTRSSNKFSLVNSRIKLTKSCYILVPANATEGCLTKEQVEVICNTYVLHDSFRTLLGCMDKVKRTIADNNLLTVNQHVKKINKVAMLIDKLTESVDGCVLACQEEFLK